MFKEYSHELTGGPKVLYGAITSLMPEGVISKSLREIQDKYPDADIGSYPFWNDGKPGTNLVVRHTEAEIVNVVCDEIVKIVNNLGGKLVDDGRPQ